LKPTIVEHFQVIGDDKRHYARGKAFLEHNEPPDTPVVVLDAWAYGLPVVTTPVGGILDIAEKGKNVLLFNAGDTDGMARCFKRLIEDETQRKKMAEHTIELSQEILSINQINKEIGELNRSL